MIELGGQFQQLAMTDSFSMSEPKNVVFNQEILENFYKNLAAHQKNGAVIQTIAEIDMLWSIYVQEFSSKKQVQASALTPLVVYQPQTLPKKFTCLDVFKAVIRATIPDWQLKKHLQLDLHGNGGRIDEYLGRIRITQNSNGHYELCADGDADKELFEGFVAENEINLGNSSWFKPFENFLWSQVTLDKYTRHDFSLMFRDAVYENFVEILRDKDFIEMCNLAKFDLASLIEYWHGISGCWMTVFIHNIHGLKAAAIEDFYADPARHSRFVQMEGHVRVAKDIRLGFAAATIFESYTDDNFAAPNILNQYLQHTRRAIVLGLMPAFTSENQALQAIIYSKEVSAKLNSVGNEAGIALQLGLNEGESYKKFICDPYDFPNDIFHYFLSVESVSDDEIVEYFFLANVKFLSQLDRQRCKENIYSFIIAELWRGFLNDARCYDFVRYRCSMINITISAEALIFINEVFGSNSRTLETTKKLAKFLNKLVQSNRELLLTFAEAIHDYSSTQLECKSVREEDYLVLCLQNELSEISSPSGKSISLLLNCKYLPIKHRLGLVGAIAEAVYLDKGWNPHRECYEKMSELYRILEIEASDAIHACTTGNIIKDTAEVVLKIFSQQDISVLLSWHEDEESMPKKYATLLVMHMQYLFEGQDLTELRTYLDRLCQLYSSSNFYPKIKREKGVSSVIEMIDEEKMWLYILLAFKSIAEKNKKIASNSLSQFYNKVCEFFSVSDVFQEPKTVEMFFSVIKECVSPRIPQRPVELDVSTI